MPEAIHKIHHKQKVDCHAKLIGSSHNDCVKWGKTSHHILRIIDSHCKLGKADFSVATKC
ncbi:hypothetical protein ACWIWK_04990 [Helicobacter sp. 23-1048]